MSFQAYIDNIRLKTGKTPVELRELAEAKGLLEPGRTVTQFTDGLKADFGLGHGHAMSIVKWFKDNGWMVFGKRP